MNKIIVTQTRGYSGKENYPNSIEESVATNVATLLYNLGKDDDLNQTLTYGVDTTDSNRPVTSIKGSIKVPATYSNYLEYFEIKYPELKISATNTYIYFEDPVVELCLISAGLGDGTGITALEASTFDLNKMFQENTDITSFNAFKYFTKANTNPSNNSSGMFLGCTNLEQVDLSNCQILKSNAFRQTGLTEVYAPSLLSMESSVFNTCTSLSIVRDLGNIILIPTYCFYKCPNLTSVNIPTTCLSIENQAFENCSSLTDITGLDNVYSIGWNAFLLCSLLNLDILSLQNITTLGGSAFSGTRISGILNLPKLTSVGTIAFNNCISITKVKSLGTISSIPTLLFSMNNSGTSALTEVCLPYECTSLGNKALQNASALSSLKLYNKSINEYQENEIKTFFSNLSKITNWGELCLYNCLNLSLTTSDISNAVTIGARAFYNVNLTGNVILPSLTSLGSNAFEKTKITSCNLSGSLLTSLEGEVFKDCTNLTTLSLPSTVTSIGKRPFWNCSSLTSVDLSNILDFNMLFSLGSAFNGCSSLTSLGVTSFSGLTFIGRNSFRNCSSLTGSLSFPDLVTAICSGNDGGIFNGCIGLTKLSFGHLQYSRNDGDIQGLGFVGAVFSSATRGLAGGCTNLKIVDLGDSIYRIGHGHFIGCNSLKAVIIRNTIPLTIAESSDNWSQIFGTNTTVLYVPQSSLSDWRTASWFSTACPDVNTYIKSIENDYNESLILGS